MVLLKFEDFSAETQEDAAVRLWQLAPTFLDEFPYNETTISQLITDMGNTTSLLQPVIDAMITNYITQIPSLTTENVETVWTEIKAITVGDTATTDINLFINTLVTLVNDSRVTFATRNDISNSVNDILTPDNLDSFNAAFNSAQTNDLNTALAAVTQMNNLWNNFGNELNTAVPGALTNDAVANLQAAAPLIEEVINQLSPSS